MTFAFSFVIINAFVGCSNKIAPQNRGVAQLVARLVRDQEVVGSNPVASTKNPKNGVSIFGFFVSTTCDGIRGVTVYFPSPLFFLFFHATGVALL